MQLPLPPSNDEEVLAYLQQLATALEEMNRPDVQYMILEEWFRAPDNLIDGMVVRADGTSWNPGTGAGVYRYTAVTDTWTKLG